MSSPHQCRHGWQTGFSHSTDQHFSMLQGFCTKGARKCVRTHATMKLWLHRCDVCVWGVRNQCGSSYTVRVCMHLLWSQKLMSTPEPSSPRWHRCHHPLLIPSVSLSQDGGLMHVVLPTWMDSTIHKSRARISSMVSSGTTGRGLATR